jgi:hypothetical protein
LLSAGASANIEPTATGETTLNLGQNILAIAIAVGSALFQAGLNRVWPWEKRRPYNELIGWQITVLGTTYAVILGFMLYTDGLRRGQPDQRAPGAPANAIAGSRRWPNSARWINTA